jgi:capsular exopolysaccharide synthesis family protein
VTVSQPRRDAYIVTLAFATTDSLLARDVPNAMTAQYLERRQSNRTEDARNSVKFLKEQLSRVSLELSGAEESFRSFKQTRQVLDPQVETSSEVGRLVGKEAERSSVDAERSALAKSLAEIEASAISDSIGAGRYQQLVGLPFFLKNPAAGTVLSALMAAQAERAALVGRTAKDPDYEVLTAKINDLQRQLHAITTTYLDGLTNQVGSLNQQLLQFQRQLDSIPSKQLQYGRLDRRVKALEEIYALLQGRLQEAEIAEAARDISVQVVDTATAPSAPSSPNLMLNALVALTLGLLVGLLAAVVREYRDNSVHTRHDIVVATGVPVLGLIPRMSRSNGRVALIAERMRAGQALPSRSKSEKGSHQYAFVKTLPVTADRRAADTPAAVGQLALSDWGRGVAEAYGLLQTNLAFAHSGPPIKVVVVTSPLAEDGKTTCATNLAITLALRGSSTLLIDADLRRGVVHVPFEVNRAPGLAEALVRPAFSGDMIRSVRVGPENRELHFLTTGTLPAEPSGLLESGFPALLERLREQFDFIVIDSPPVNIISDASVLGLHADGVLVVARSGVTQSGALSYATEQLARVGVPLLGVVLNDIDFKRDVGYDSSYQAYAGNEYVKASRGSQG